MEEKTFDKTFVLVAKKTKVEGIKALPLRTRNPLFPEAQMRGAWISSEGSERRSQLSHLSLLYREGSLGDAAVGQGRTAIDVAKPGRRSVIAKLNNFQALSEMRLSPALD